MARDRPRQGDPQGSIEILPAGTRPSAATKSRFIDGNHEEFGVTPIGDVSVWNVSTYYTQRCLPSERALRDDYVAGEICRVFDAIYRVHGYRKGACPAQP